jgi:hypothetical protein
VLWLCGVVCGGVWSGLLARPGARGCRGAESYFPYHCDVIIRLCVALCVCVWCYVGVSGWWGGEERRAARGRLRLGRQCVVS